MSKHDPAIRLLHMRDFARKALELTQGKSKADVESDEVLLLALTHLLEPVGEAAAHVPPEIQAKYPGVPWPKIVSMRNRLIHGYDYVDYNIVWDAVTRNLPEMLKELDTGKPGDATKGRTRPANPSSAIEVPA